ncbi:hypothetical protein ACGFYV_09790 [Streptomyces sp. NPDC048297]
MPLLTTDTLRCAASSLQRDMDPLTGSITLSITAEPPELVQDARTE